MLTLGSFGDVLFGCLVSFWTAAKFAIALCILHLEVSVVHNGWQSQSMKVVLALAIILPALAAKLPRTSRVFLGKGSRFGFSRSRNCQHVQGF